MNEWNFIDEYAQNFMDERLNIHGIKFIHGIMVARRDIPWLGTSVSVMTFNNELNLLELKNKGYPTEV